MPDRYVKPRLLCTSQDLLVGYVKAFELVHHVVPAFQGGNNVLLRAKFFDFSGVSSR